MILSSHGLIASQIASFDADAAAFFARVTAAGGTLSATEKIATNQLVLDLKANSLWTSMKAIYPMVGASAAACAQNLKSSSFTGTFTSGWTFASTGVTPNGLSAYMDTNLNENTQITLNSLHLSHYSRTNNTTTACDIGLFDTPNARGSLTFSYISGNAVVRNFDFSSAVSRTSSTAGMFINNRIISTQSKYFFNNTLFNTNNVNSIAKTNLNYFLASRNLDGVALNFSNREYAFASIGDGLLDTQASAFYSVVQSFQVALNRAV